MAHIIDHILRRSPFRRQVREALRAGTGLYVHTWPLTDVPGSADVPPVEEVLTWCRETIAHTRRPYGLDHITLTLALLDAAGNTIAATKDVLLRPLDFYTPDGAEALVRRTLEDWRRRGHTPASAQLGVVLFSWGDLTRALLAAG